MKSTRNARATESIQVVPFHRMVLADQVAATLRQGIERGIWNRFLPSEHRLAQDFGVSRQSIHAGILQLENAGLVRISRGRRTRVVSQRHSTPAARTVCALTPRFLSDELVKEDPFRLALRAELAARGIGWTEIVDARLAARNPEATLAKLVAERRSVCWIIDWSFEPIQRFLARAGVPTLVLGSCYPGVNLPSVDSDYRAVGRHAAGQIARFRHPHVALILPPRPLPGDLACRDGLVEALGQLRRPVSVTEVLASYDTAEFKTRLNRLLTAKRRATVFFTMQVETTQLVLFHLLRSGLRVPQDVSLIARDSHAIFDIGSPEITRYCSSNLRKARMAGRIVELIFAGRRVPREPALTTPTFVAGETMAHPPSV